MKMNPGYEVAKVTANGAEISPVNGVYYCETCGKIFSSQSNIR